MFKFLKENIRRFNANTKKFYHGRYLRAWISLFYCAIRFGCSFDDYYRYEFYKKSNYERGKFVTYIKSKRIIHKYNSPKFNMVFQDKRVFNEQFSAFIKREYLRLDNATQEEFCEFLDKHGTVIMKDAVGGQGIGVFKINKDQKDIYKVSEYRGYLAEQVLVQHEELSKLNQFSVNSIRVLSFKGEIVACALRVGMGDVPVDNLHAGGICGCIDPDSGIVVGPNINNDMEKFLFHPHNGVKLVGFQVPQWSEVKELVLKAVDVVPNVNYVGWDIAILQDGVALIEANHDPGHDVVQMIAQTGVYEKIKKIIKKSK